MIEISFTSCNLFQLHGCRGYVCPNIALALYFEIILKNCWKRPMAVCLSLAGSVPAGTLGAAPRAWPWTGREPWPSLASPSPRQQWRASDKSGGGCSDSQALPCPSLFAACPVSPAQCMVSHPASTHSFNFQVHLQASTSSFNFQQQFSFNFQLQLPASTSSFNFQVQLPASTSSFNFQLQQQASFASFNCKLHLQASAAHFNSQAQLPLPASTSSFHFQLPLPASTSKSNFQI